MNILLQRIKSDFVYRWLCYLCFVCFTLVSNWSVDHSSDIQYEKECVCVILLNMGKLEELTLQFRFEWFVLFFSVSQASQSKQPILFTHKSPSSQRSDASLIDKRWNDSNSLRMVYYYWFWKGFYWCRVGFSRSANESEWEFCAPIQLVNVSSCFCARARQIELELGLRRLARNINVSICVYQHFAPIFRNSSKIYWN